MRLHIQCNLRWVATSIATMVLVACGGGGGGGTPASTTPPQPVQATPSFSLVGPQDTDPVVFACGSSDGDKTQARYPSQYGGSNPLITLVSMPDGGAMGRTQTGGPSVYTNTYFRIDTTGRRTAYTARALDEVRVDMDGQLWWIGADKTLWRGPLQPNGQDERIGSTTNFGAVPTDGASSQLALGQVRGFAATQGAAFLLVTDDSAAHYYVRRMTRNADATWQSSSIAVPTNVAQAGDGVSVLANRSGQLALIVWHSTQLPTSFLTASKTSTVVSYWQWQADNNWHSVASQTIASDSNFPSYSTTSLGLDSATLDDNGNVIWGGGANATLYQMGQNGSWTILARPANASGTTVGQDGTLQNASFLSAYSVSSAPNGGLLFYDAETCQVRKLSNQTLTTVSGPSYTIRPHFAGANLVGFDSNNALVFGHTESLLAPGSLSSYVQTVPRPLTAKYDLASKQLTTIEAVGSIHATTNDGCEWAHNNWSTPCTSYDLDAGAYAVHTFDGLDAASGTLYASRHGQVLRVSATDIVSTADVPSAPCPTTFATSSTALARQSDFPYFIASDRGCGGSAPSVSTLYRFDAGSNALQPVFPGKPTPLVAGEADFVQKRTDDAYWVAGANVVDRLTSSGSLVSVAGNHATPALQQDGQGSAAGFVGIKRIRILPDNRLLVLDADAVRLVDDTGTVRTLFTLASTGIAGGSFVDLIPKGHDIYMTLANQPMLMLAKDVLP